MQFFISWVATDAVGKRAGQSTTWTKTEEDRKVLKVEILVENYTVEPDTRDVIVNFDWANSSKRFLVNFTELNHTKLYSPGQRFVIESRIYSALRSYFSKLLTGGVWVGPEDG